jgi:hypothetical protein
MFGMGVLREGHPSGILSDATMEEDAVMDRERWEVDLPIHPTAVAEARRVLRQRFAREMTPAQLDDATLLVSELVGQAIVAGPPLHELRVTGDIWDGGVRLTVQDDRPVGRGGDEQLSLSPGSVPFRIVSELSEAFGELRVNDITIVWCELPRGEMQGDRAGAAGTPGP